MFGYHHLNLKRLNFIQFENLDYKTKILIACKLELIETNIPAPQAH
ncbi:hypothetical protein N407_08465 [Helicobacter pylori FD662]|nr:hypothetical protein N407_08465 [Helicobacter pylori FD662]